MASEPISKKRRPKYKDLQVNAFRAKEEDVWFEDGNIVLVAQDTPFLVHKSVLATKSDVFRDTFSVARAECDEMLDGIPILRLADGWIDVRNMLVAIYHSERYVCSCTRIEVFDDLNPVNVRYFEHGESMEFSVIRSFLCLGTKYEVRTLRQEAVRRLRICFPVSFEQYLSQHIRRGRIIRMNPVDAMEVVHIAQLCDLPDVLPSALYECTLLSAHELLEGPYSSITSISVLSMIFDTQRRLANSSIIFLKDTMLRQPAVFCLSPEVCSAEIQNGFSRIWSDLVESAGDMISEYSTVNVIGGSSCLACSRNVEVDCKAFYQNVWGRLGDYFNVEPWPMKEEDLSA